MPAQIATEGEASGRRCPGTHAWNPAFPCIDPGMQALCQCHGNCFFPPQHARSFAPRLAEIYGKMQQQRLARHKRTSRAQISSSFRPSSPAALSLACLARLALWTTSSYCRVRLAYRACTSASSAWAAARACKIPGKHATSGFAMWKKTGLQSPAITEEPANERV